MATNQEMCYVHAVVPTLRQKCQLFWHKIIGFRLNLVKEINGSKHVKMFRREAGS